ncbi:MAG: hypothetical protein WB441_12505 [Nocardioidaceae bacterium]
MDAARRLRHDAGSAVDLRRRHGVTVLVEVMAAVRGDCPVRLACLAHVAHAHVTGGFWAGADRDPHAAGTGWTRPGDQGLALAAAGRAREYDQWRAAQSRSARQHKA